MARPQLLKKLDEALSRRLCTQRRGWNPRTGFRGLGWPGLERSFLIAVQGDEYIALRDLGGYGDNETLLGGLLGVWREYRQRGIAVALQVRNIAYARYRLLKDCTAIQNTPMQTLFDRLGFIRDPEWQQCQKDLL